MAVYLPTVITYDNLTVTPFVSVEQIEQMAVFAVLKSLC